MKNLFVILMMSVLSLGAFAQTNRGDFTVGGTIGYGFDSQNPVLGVNYRYNITDEFRLAPSFNYFVKNNGLSACAIDVNVHYVVRLADQFGFYPLAGLDLSFWKNRYDLLGHHFTEKDTRFGLNLGLGGEFYATENWSIGLELKYNIIKDYDQAILGLHVGYSF